MYRHQDAGSLLDVQLMHGSADGEELQGMHETTSAESIDKEYLRYLLQTLAIDPNNRELRADVINHSINYFLYWAKSQPPAAAHSMLADVMFTTRCKETPDRKLSDLSPLEQAILRSTSHFDFFFIDGYTDQPGAELTEKQTLCVQLRGQIDVGKITEWQSLLAETTAIILQAEQEIFAALAKQRAEESQSLTKLQEIRDLFLVAMQFDPDQVQGAADAMSAEALEAKLHTTVAEFVAQKTSAIQDEEQALTLVCKQILAAICEVTVTNTKAHATFLNFFAPEHRALVSDWIQRPDFQATDSAWRNATIHDVITRMHHDEDLDAPTAFTDALIAQAKLHIQLTLAEAAQTKTSPSTTLLDAVPKGILHAQQLATQRAGYESEEELLAARNARDKRRTLDFFPNSL